MRHIALILAVLTLTACAAATGPAGQPSPGGDVNPVSGTRATGH